MNPANVLTSLRIVLSPFFVYFLYTGDDRTAFAVYVVAWASDGIDGFVARRFHYQSKLGAYLDPIADKIFLVTTYVSLGYFQYIPLWLVALVVFKDVLTGLGTFVLIPLVGVIDIKPLPEGKAATFFQLTTAFVVLLVERGGYVELKWYSWALIMITAALTAFSAVHYVVRGIQILRRRGDGQER